jgi:8-oxo-dGTP pyrophosphatase MutT (NUDIX family)
LAVNPRPASTVVLLDQMSNVYLTKRPKTMKFFGGYCVFPGGAVEKADYLIQPPQGKIVETFDFAYYVAAARELFEEVGIILVRQEDGTPFHVHNERLIEYRRLLNNGEISFIDICNNEGVQLQLENIRYFGHLITPEESPIRFDTRFFLAKLPDGQSPKPNLNEVEEAFWISPEEALHEERNGKIYLAPPTILALKTIINAKPGTPLFMPNLPMKWVNKN